MYRYPMEMHIVHRNMAYSNFSHALQHEDGVAVIAVFFQVREIYVLKKQQLYNVLYNNKKFAKYYLLYNNVYLNFLKKFIFKNLISI